MTISRTLDETLFEVETGFLSESVTLEDLREFICICVESLYYNPIGGCDIEGSYWELVDI